MNPQELDVQSKTKLSQLGEFGFIERLQSKLSSSTDIVLSVGDDAAILQPLRVPIVTCDALIEGVHFRRDWTSARDLGWKSLCVNLSDLAAMAARPVAAVIALALSPTITLQWLDEFYEGLNLAATSFGCPIIGGDTTRAPHDFSIAITAIGDMSEKCAPLRRDGAQIGDVLVLSGATGESAAGLWSLLHPECALPPEVATELLARHFCPTPRLREAHALNETLPHGALHACLDISDGLAGDARHIARASGVTLEIDSVLLPLTPALQRAAEIAQVDALDWALGGGEDYELLWSIAPEHAETACEILRACGTHGTIIGRVVEREEALVLVVDGNDQRRTLPPSWTHF